MDSRCLGGVYSQSTQLSSGVREGNVAQQQNTARGLKVVGTAGPPIDAVERVTGQAKYVGDLELPGMLVARVLRTRHAHARIVGIDTSRAEALAGVRAVITHKDAPKVPIWGNRTYMLNEQVRFAGEAVAAVAAVDDETAEKALRLIDVKYEVLKFVLDPEAALQQGAPQLFPDGNLEGEPRTITRGDLERGFAECDRVIERVYHCPTMWSGGMEPRVAIAQWEGNRLTVWASTQAPCRVQTNLTGQFNLPDSQVRSSRATSAAGSAPRARRTSTRRLQRSSPARRGGP